MSKKLSRNERIGVGTLVVGILSLPLTSPEVRQWLHLEKRPVVVERASGLGAASTMPIIHEDSHPAPTTAPNPPSKTKQHSRVAVHGDNNVAGNNVTGNGITGHDNYVTAPAPIFVGPGSIGITGGTVTNPTVNNFGPPARRIRPENRDDVIAILKQKPIKIDIAYVSGDETFQFANDMYEALKEAGWRMGGFNQVVLMTPWRGVRVDYYESGGNKLPVERLVTVPKDSSAETLIKALMKAGIRNISVHPNEEDPQDSIRLLVAPYPG